MSQLKKFSGVALASAFVGLVIVAPMATKADSDVTTERVRSDRAVVSESSAIPFEFSHNLGGSPGELY